MYMYYHFIVLVPPKFLVTPRGRYFSAETIYVGGADGTIPSCLICVNCSVRGTPIPTMTWQYQSGTMSGFDDVITNHSNVSSPYYQQDNGQVNINVLTMLLFLTLILPLHYRSCVSMMLEDIGKLLPLPTSVVLQMLLDQYQLFLTP